MCFSREQLLVFGLGVAATAALSYKFTRDLFGRQTISAKQSRTGRKDRGCAMDGRATSINENKTLTMADFTGQTPKEWASGDVINNNNIASTDDVTSIGDQSSAAPPQLVDSETQTDVIDDSMASEELMVALNLKLIHTNVFMLKKHFDEDLSKQLVGDLNVAFYKSEQSKLHLLKASSKMDLEVGTAFCAEKYHGKMVMRSQLPWKLLLEKSVSSLKVFGKKIQNNED
ncbi:hypothetical protein BSL78_20158 [Apostichopus japonicus]|uniref:Uncharacterized protein n=1 Tax=Stichopus japonicus TaxID=307972 RepID=A0A2G8K4N4_STIJA|nr:hypothetical protein BSL78_20158 [Apostichopus japonicus]